MYFKEGKDKRIGTRFEGGKLKKKLVKSIEQLKRHDPEIKISSEPTEYLFVSNSSILCNVGPDEVESIFKQIDEACTCIVYPNKRSYSFVKMSSVNLAIEAMFILNGLVHPSLKSSHQPFLIAFVENLPNEKLRTDLSYPNDLRIVDNYISNDDEEELCSLLMNNENLCSLKHRAVVHYGHIFDYDTNSASATTDPIPEIIERLIDRFIADGLTGVRPDQVTMNMYEPGQGIPSHYDTHSAFEDPVISLSMLSDVVMDFKDGANSARIAPVLLPRLSLCLIQGESRYRWKHGIVNRKYDIDPVSNRMVSRKLRISLTFRKIRFVPCQCDFKEFCDWDRQGEMSIPQSAEAAKKLEDSYVSNVYESISSHFDETRHSSWKAVAQFLNDLPRHSVLYDVGCGNGKYLVPKDGLIKIGCDMCEGLCSIASKKDCQIVRADGLHLPFKECADAVISIAVLHHMSSLERRQQFIREIVRVLQPGGKACITVWSMDQSDSEYAKMRSNKDENNSLDTGKLRLRIHDGKTFTQQDVLVPWVIDSQKETFLRFYHVFREGEMEELVASVEGCHLLDIFKEQGNYIAIISKNI